MNDEITTQPREIWELLRLDTYQGMSDEEIDTLITYKCELARNDELCAANIQAVQESATIAANAQLQLAEDSRQLLNSLCSTPVFLESVENA